jgi:hypothetical protein
MPTPTDVAGVKRLCGMVQYMAKFLPDLANENILFFASGIQLTKFRLVLALSLFVGLTTPGDDNVIGDGKRTIQITKCFGVNITV